MTIKRSLASVLAGLLMMPMLSACGNPAPAAPEVPKDPLTFDYPSDATNFAYFTKNDSWETLAMAGPYYMTPQTIAQPIFGQYDQLRSAKIDEAEKLTLAVYDGAKATEEKLRDLKGSYLDFFDSALAADPKLLPVGKAVAQNLITQELKVEGLEASYEGHTLTTTDPLVKAFVEYQKTMVAVDLADAVNRDVAGFLSSAAQIVPTLTTSDTEGVAAAAKDFDGKMESLSDLNDPLSAMQENVGNLSAALKQLNTGEHFMGLGTLAYVTQQLPALKAKAAGLTPGANLDADTIQFVKDYADAFGSFADDMTAEIQKADPSTLYTPPAQTGWVPGANADGYFDSAFKALSATASAAKTGAGMAWSATKTVYGKATTGLGYTLDATNALVKSGMDIGFGIANGVSTDETAYQIRLNYGKVYDNYKKGTSGSEVLKTAGEMLDSADAAGQTAAKTVVEKVADTGKAAADKYLGQSDTTNSIFQTGKEWTAWGAGQLGKMTVGMFTGFGKGLYKVSDKQATTSQIVEGTLDIGLSFIGGSKVIIKGSQALKGSKEALTVLGEKGLNMAEKALANSELERAKALAKEGVQTVLGSEAEIAAKQALAAELNTIGQSINQRFADLIAKGGKTVFANTLEGKTAYKEFVKDTFEKSLAGYKDALLKTTGDNMKDYVDNLVASKADDLMKAIVVDFAAKGIIPGFGGPFDGHYKGPVVFADQKDFTMPTDVQVTNGVIDGKITYSQPFMEKATLTVNITLTGSVDTEGNASGDVSGNVSLTGDTGAIHASIGGNFSGKATTTDIDLTNISLTVTCIDPPKGVTCDGSTVKPTIFLNKLP